MIEVRRRSLMVLAAGTVVAVPLLGLPVLTGVALAINGVKSAVQNVTVCTPTGR